MSEGYEKRRIFLSYFLPNFTGKDIHNLFKDCGEV
jgi:hypothetical protein